MQSIVVVVMGVSGSGKTTIGRLLAAEVACHFYDADDYHSAANKQRMSEGKPLDDLDRAAWLEELRGLVTATLERGECAVLACSALKATYRDRLRVDPARVLLVYLKGNPELVSTRLARRVGHFAAPDLLVSQFSTLEEPTDAIVIDIAESPRQIVARLRALIAAASER